jgi:hypothetical protein
MCQFDRSNAADKRAKYENAVKPEGGRGKVRKSIKRGWDGNRLEHVLKHFRPLIRL